MVHVYFDPHSVKLYSQFRQVGYGSYFEGLPYQRGYGYQRGLGIGSIFASLLRYILPFAKSAGKTVGKEALVTGARILDNLSQGVRLKDAVITESKQGAKRAAQKLLTKNYQTGSGISTKKKKSSKKLPNKSLLKRVLKGKTRKRKSRRKILVGGKVLKSAAIKRRRLDSLGFY